MRDSSEPAAGGSRDRSCTTQADAEKRAAGGEDLEVMDWYFPPQEAKQRR